MDRRVYLVTAGIGASSLLAGCLSDGSSDDDGTDDTDDESGTGTGSEPDPDPVINAYLDAAEDEDTEAMADVVHIASPLQDLLTDPEWEFELYGEDENEPSTSWAGSWANVQLDPAGDQIVVIAVRGDDDPRG